MTLPTISVSQLNAYVKKMFDSDLMFASVLLTGEISNFSPHYKTGHLYFTLKDDAAAVKAVMFSKDAGRLRFRPENGMKVLAAGRVSVFERDGIYQIYIRELIPDGAGALSVAFEQLKKRLEAKGLFVAEHKQKLPDYPKRIGVITSPGGAALQDILNILRRRYPLSEVIVAGVTVQGATAASEMTHALKKMNALHCADVIILGRGGGSAEDLWCFNDETLAWAIFESEIPVISAVGHETDYTIADYVSDLRAPTPSAAAELAVPDIADLEYRVSILSQALFSAAGAEISMRRQQLSFLLARKDVTNGAGFFAPEFRRFTELRLRLKHAFKISVAAERERYVRSQKRLPAAIAACAHQKRLRLAEVTASLEGLNPLSVLLRGYAILQSGNAVKSHVSDFYTGELVGVQLADGSMIAQIKEIYKHE